MPGESKYLFNSDSEADGTHVLRALGVPMASIETASKEKEDVSLVEMAKDLLDKYG